MSDRLLLGSGFPDDTGAADPTLVRALEAYDTDRSRYAEALAALVEARVLVPVVAVLGKVAYDEDGLAHDKSSDMAAVLMQGADGRTALLAFSATESLATWDPQARPVPVTARLAAQAAVQEGATALVLDLAGPVRFVVEGDDLAPLAQGWRLTRVGERTAWLRPASPDERDDDGFDG